MRNVIIRRTSRPLETKRAPAEDEWVRRFREGDFTADALIARYAAQVYRLTGSYEEAARRMALDRRTVKAKIESYLRETTAK